LVVAAVVVGVLITNNGGTDASAEPAIELSYGEAVVTDLVQTESFDGTLGAVDGDPVTTQFSGTVTAAAAAGDIVEQGDVLFSIDGDPVVLLYGTAPAYRDLAMGVDSLNVPGRLPGTITEVAEPGTALEQGDVLYRVNGEPVVVLYGDVPAYRIMRDASTNLEGDDVEQLETALVSLGFDPDGTVTVDQEFTYSTGQMVEAWQEQIGAEADGVVDFGEVVFIPGPSQVRTSAAVGDSSGGGAPVATLITGEQMVGIDVQQLESALAALGFDPGVVDDTFTDDTRKAVLQWQAAIGLAEDGVVDVGEVLFLDGAVLVSEQLSPSGSRGENRSSRPRARDRCGW
jgi:peptidoglycan hydrolase-like protein with peptidoglycan-binding domain